MVALTGQVDQPRQDLLQYIASQQMRETDERLGVRHSFAVDPAEGTVDQASPNLALALVEAPVVEVVQDKYPQHHLGRGARTTFPSAAGPSAPECLGHQIDEPVIIENLVHSTQSGVPQLVRVRQQHFEHASLDVLATNHPSSFAPAKPRQGKHGKPTGAHDSARPAHGRGLGASSRPRHHRAPRRPEAMARNSPWSCLPCPGS